MKRWNALWITVLVLGWCFDFLFWKHKPGVSFAIFVVLCLTGGFVILGMEGLKPAWKTLLLLAPILFFAATTFVRLEPMTVFLAVVFVLLLMGVLAATYLGGRWLEYSLLDYLANLLRLTGSLIARPLISLSERRAALPETAPTAPKVGWKRFWAVLRGLFREDEAGVLPAPDVWQATTVEDAKFDGEALVYLSTDAPDAAYALRFNGQSVALFYSEGPDRGIFRVYLDGEPYALENGAGLERGEVNAYRRTVRWNNRLTVEADEPGIHTLIVRNTGTAPAVINSITLGAANIPFTLSDLPPLPLTLAAGASAGFTVRFAPVAVGAASATLKVDTQSFTLSGAGEPPDPLPYQFVAPSGPQQPMQQLGVGLALEAPYPLAITGTLTLSFNSEVFSDDPAVQFATGGRKVSFTIPANSTRAVFPQNAPEIKIQTGTVAGTITLTPSFATESGINLTPSNPPVLALTVPQGAPRLLSVALSSKTSSAITLLVSGYATNRSVTQMDFQFTAV